MIFHAIAAAITGNDSRFTKLTCTATAIDSDQTNQVCILSQHSFSSPWDLHSETDTLSCLNRLSQIATQVNESQEIAQSMGNHSPRPVALLLGTDGRQKYDLKKLYELILTKIPGELKKALGDFLASTYFELGNFRQYLSSEECDEIKKDLESQEILELNGLLNALKIELSLGNAEALDTLKEVAREFAKKEAAGIAARYKPEDIQHLRWFPTYSPWRNFHEDDKLQQAHPGLCILTWHPEIRQAFKDELLRILQIKKNVLVKCPADAPAPFYVDVTTAMVMDQIDVWKGLKTEEQIASRPVEIKFAEVLSDSFRNT